MSLNDETLKLDLHGSWKSLRILSLTVCLILNACRCFGMMSSDFSDSTSTRILYFSQKLFPSQNRTLINSISIISKKKLKFVVSFKISWTNICSSDGSLFLINYVKVPCLGVCDKADINTNICPSRWSNPQLLASLQVYSQLSYPVVKLCSLRVISHKILLYRKGQKSESC